MKKCEDVFVRAYRQDYSQSDVSFNHFTLHIKTPNPH